MSKLKPSKKKQIWLRDKFICFYCNKKIKDGTQTVDHIIARYLGGTNKSENLVTACRPCNNQKSIKYEQPPIRNPKWQPVH